MKRVRDRRPNSLERSQEALTWRDQQAIARRAQILETALRLFAMQGFDGTSTREIAQAAGISEGLIFHYFPTKEDLLNSVFDTRHSFIGELRQLLGDAEGRPVGEVLPTLARGWLSTLRKERELTLVVFAIAQHNRDVGQALGGLIGEGVGRLAAYLRGRVAAGELRADLPVESSALIFFSGLMLFFLTNHLLEAEEWRKRADQFTHDMLDVWLHGAAA